jgi:hypothetical protein
MASSGNLAGRRLAQASAFLPRQNRKANSAVRISTAGQRLPSSSTSREHSRPSPRPPAATSPRTSPRRRPTARPSATDTYFHLPFIPRTADSGTARSPSTSPRFFSAAWYKIALRAKAVTKRPSTHLYRRITTFPVKPGRDRYFSPSRRPPGDFVLKSEQNS